MSLTTSHTLSFLQKYLHMNVKAIAIKNNKNENIYISPLLDEHKSQPPMISRFPTKNAVLNCFYLMMKTIKTQEIPF